MFLYHLDREQSLKENSEIKLHPIVPAPESKFLLEFSSGVSQFGMRQMQRYYSFLDCIQIPSLGEYIKIESLRSAIGEQNQKIIELTFEMVRRMYFSNLPSRFTSLFALDSVSDFRRWPELTYSKQFDIYKIEVPDSTIRFDSNFLRGGLQILTDDSRYNLKYSLDIPIASMLDLACQYWSKSQTENPRWEYLVPLPVKILTKFPWCASEDLPVSDKKSN